MRQPEYPHVAHRSGLPARSLAEPYRAPARRRRCPDSVAVSSWPGLPAAFRAGQARPGSISLTVFRPGLEGWRCREACPRGSELRLEGTEVGATVPAARFVASVRGQLRVITDTDAPRSVVPARKKTEEGRLRSAFGSREWLRPARRRGIVPGARPWCGPRLARAGMPAVPVTVLVRAVGPACGSGIAITARRPDTRGPRLAGRPLPPTPSVPALRRTRPLLFWPGGAHGQFDSGPGAHRTTSVLALGRTGPLPFWPGGTQEPI